MNDGGGMMELALLFVLGIVVIIGGIFLYVVYGALKWLFQKKEPTSTIRKVHETSKKSIRNVEISVSKLSSNLSLWAPFNIGAPYKNRRESPFEAETCSIRYTFVMPQGISAMSRRLVAALSESLALGGSRCP